VNRFLGDGVLALFGPASSAVAAARDLLAEAARLRERGGVWADFHLGIGIDSGEVLLGAIGGPERVEYTAVGATVNRAARLQGLSRKTQLRLVISASCAAALGPEFDLVPLGDVRLKGFEGAEPVYSLPDP
jgi:adenylate cyclase